VVKNEKFVTVSLPEPLLRRIDLFIEKYGQQLGMFSRPDLIEKLVVTFLAKYSQEYEVLEKLADVTEKDIQKNEARKHKKKKSDF
jgi:metal-responsive CopG/Arc/MetJ family transcriptional regulator